MLNIQEHNGLCLLFSKKKTGCQGTWLDPDPYRSTNRRTWKHNHHRRKYTNENDTEALFFSEVRRYAYILGMTTGTPPHKKQQLHWHPGTGRSRSLVTSQTNRQVISRLQLGLPHVYGHLDYRVRLQLYPSPEYNSSRSVTKLYIFDKYLTLFYSTS